jgi:hypothetical protein
MKRKFKKYFFLFFIALIAIAAITVYQTWNKPHRDIKDAKALVVPATELYNNLANGSGKNNLIYINKIVAVSGEIKEVLKNEKNQQVILLKTTVPDGYVNCTMEENIHNPKNGDNVFVKGICSGYIGADLGLPGDVFLIRCYPSS